MNYAGKFDTAVSLHGADAASHSYVHADSFAAHAPADAIIVPDADLLFGGDYKRLGSDLVLSKDGREYVVHNYFKGGKHVALASPDGAHLTGNIVDALTGEVEVSQAAGDAAAHQVIGHVTKLAGSASVIRNGVSIVLNMGDNVEKGDVVQAGANSTLGLTFIDGTVFGLSSNARMVLNDMVYDPNGSNNSSLLSLVAGTITFVAGQTAKHGDMKIDTPVATMGIRGTAVLVEIDFAVPGQNSAPNASFQVLVEPDGTTGSYVLFDKTTLQPIAVVNQAGQQINFNNGVVSQTNSPLPPDIQKLIQDVFQQKFTDNSNTKSTSPSNDSTIPHSDAIVIKLADGSSATATYQNIDPASSSPSAPSSATVSLEHVPGAPTTVVLDALGQVTTSFAFSEIAGKTGDSADLDTAKGTVNFADINAGDRPTVTIDFSSFTYQNAAHDDVTAKLSPLQLADIAATEVKINVVPSAGNNNNGSVSFSYSLADNAFDFLAAGETLTLTYLVRVATNFAPDNEATVVPITITITGTNDAPVITSGPPTVAFFGGTSMPGGDLNSADATSGTLSFDDVDLTDTHTVAAKLSSAVLSGGGSVPPGPEKVFESALSASIASDSTGTGTGVIDWSLAPLSAYLADFIPQGQTLTLTYAVTVTDSQGASSTQTVTVTIGGTDNPAVVWIATGGSGGSWSEASNWETGTVPTSGDDVIIITNQLIGLTPSYPVTIDAPAFAKSVTMNDFSATAPELDNLSSLSIAGTLTLSADSILHNSGSLTVGGLAEFVDQSVLANSGVLTLAGGGDFKGSSQITNAGTIELAGGTLNVVVDVSNHCGTFTVDTGAALALNAGIIDGGTIEVRGTLDLAGSAVLQNGVLDNAGQLEVSGLGNALHAEAVTTNLALEILTGGALSIDHGSSVENGGGTITVDAAATLTLDDAMIDGGTVTVEGAVMTETATDSKDAGASVESGAALDLTGSAAVQDGTLVNDGTIDVSGSGNSFDAETVTGDAGAAIDVNGSLALELGTEIAGGMISIGISGVLEVSSALGATLCGLTVDDGNLIKVEAGSLLTLDGVSITSGNLDNSGTIEISADSTFDGVNVDNGGGVLKLDIAADGPPPSTPSTTTLTLKDGATIADGLLTIGQTGVLDVSSAPGAMLCGLTVDDGNLIKVEAGSLLTLDGVTVTSGNLDNSGTIEVASGSTFDGVQVDNTGGTIRVDVERSDSTLRLDDGTTVAHGQLSIGGSGIVEVSSALGATLSDVCVDGSGGIQLDKGSILTLTRSRIDVSRTVNESGGKLDLAGSTEVKDGTLTNDGTIEVSGSGNALDEETVFNDGAFEIQASGMLLLDGGSVFHNERGTLTVDGGARLTLDDATLSGGAIVDASGEPAPGTLDITGDSTIDCHASLSGGYLTVEGGVQLTLDNVTVACAIVTLETGGSSLQVDDRLTLDGTGITGGGITNLGTIEITGSGSIMDDLLSNSGRLKVDEGQTLTLDGSTVSGGAIVDGGTIKVDSGVTLTLESGVTVSGAGRLANSGTIDIETATGATFDGVTVDNGTGGTIEVDSAATIPVPAVLTLEGGSTVSGGLLSIGMAGELVVTTECGATLSDVCVANGGSIYVDSCATLTLDQTEITGGIITDDGAISVTGDSGIDQARVAAGTVAVAGDVTLTLDDTIITGGIVADHGTIEVLWGDSLTLDGVTVSGGSIDNWGTVEIKGSTELDGDTFANGGTIVVEPGATLTLNDATIGAGTVIDHESILTDGEAAILRGGTIDNLGELDSEGDSAIDGATVSNGGGTIDVRCGTLTLDNTTISQGAVVDDGSIKVDHGKTLRLNGVTLGGCGAIDNAGTIEIAGSGSIDNMTIANIGGLLLIDAWQTLTLGGTTSITGGLVADHGTVNVSQDDTLQLSGVSWSGGVIGNAGAIEVTGSGSIDGNWLDNHQLTVDGKVTLTLDGTTIDGGAVTDAGTINVDSFSSLDLNGAAISGGGSIDNDGVVEITRSSSIDGETIDNRGGTLVVDSHQTLTLDDTTVTGGTMLVGGTVNVDAHHALTLDGVEVLGGGGNTLANAGTLYSEGSTELDGFGSVVNTGTIEVQSGSLQIGEQVTGTGTLKIDAGDTLELGSSVSSGETIDFAASTGKLVLDDPHAFAASVEGFSGDGTLSGSDQIDLEQINYSSRYFKESYNPYTGILIVSDGSSSASLHFDGSYVNANFSFESDGHGGTIVYDPPVGGDSNGSAGTTAASDTGQPPGAGTESFVFNFTAGEASPLGLNQARDGLHFDSLPVNPPPAGASAEHEPGNAGLAGDGLDPTGWSALFKASLHHSEFHVV